MPGDASYCQFWLVSAIILSEKDMEVKSDLIGWGCHAYCLMGNHYHLMIETPQPDLTRGMRQLNGVFAQWSNRRPRTQRPSLPGLLQGDFHGEVCLGELFPPSRLVPFLAETAVDDLLIRWLRRFGSEQSLQ
jgi:hypothetical protein